jgi:hypothetical protein
VRQRSWSTRLNWEAWYLGLQAGLHDSRVPFDNTQPLPWSHRSPFDSLSGGVKSEATLLSEATTLPPTPGPGHGTWEVILIWVPGRLERVFVDGQ